LLTRGEDYNPHPGPQNGGNHREYSLLPLKTLEIRFHQAYALNNLRKAVGHKELLRVMLDFETELFYRQIVGYI
jgi:hypothetical protein